MQLNRFDNVSQYYIKVKDYLLQHEAHHCLMLGLLNALISAPERFAHSPYLAVVIEDDGRLVTVALRTPPNNLVLSRSVNPQALTIITQALHLSQLQIPGVHGPVDEANAFAQAWQEVTGQSYRLGMAQRIYQLETTLPCSRFCSE